MSKINVRMYTTLKEKVNAGSVDLIAKDVADALEQLNKKFGDKFRETLYAEDGKIKRYYILLLNGKVVDREKPEKFKLKSGDTLHIFPPIAGG